ncbi:MAG: MFS transporter [Pirellulales bacterium]|nr:MFS transporter [Pirellulales bacterium]
MESKHPPLIWARLSIFMCIEFLIWGCWGIALGGYAEKVLGLSGRQIGWLFSIPALGAIISPLFVGFIADRFFSSERMLCVLHLFSGVCLIAAGYQESFQPLMTFMMLHGLLFMPTLALGNSLIFRHIPDPDKFPRIAVFGTIGWILATLVSAIFLGGMETPNFLFLSGGASIVLSFYCLSLPHTPPKGAEGDVDAFGLGALKLLKESSFLMFILCMFLFSVPACGYYFPLVAPMLQQRGYPAPLALTSLNQFSELIFMFSMPWFVSKLGLKRVLCIGMLAWIIRYFLFMSPAFLMAILGLLLHGACYSFFYVGAYMYVDKRAPSDMKASAQSLIAFLMIGLGWFFGAQVQGIVKDKNPAPIASMGAVLGTDDTRALPPWNDPKAATSAWRYLDLSSTVQAMFKKDEKPAPPEADLAEHLDKNRDAKISIAEVQAMGADQELIFDGKTYSRADIEAVFKKIASLERPDIVVDQIELTRAEWLAAQSNNWGPIWMYPGIVLAVILGLFIVGFREESTS